jgi:GDP/UDP-N,N'-diacetylbacillosamine 2-epimerase (hydrolysing)
MESTLKTIHDHPSLELCIIATGTHLSELYGNTIDEIRAAGFAVSATVPLDLSDSSGGAMARNIGTMLQGFVGALEKIRPDMVLLLGDRGEMLAGALAAIHLNIAIAHIHGGERSGTVDEPVRHAITKLAHIHFAATEEARNRLVRMGERESDVFVSGAPGLDGLKELASIPRDALCAETRLDTEKPLALLVFHPVLQEAQEAGRHASNVIEAMLAENLQVVALMPNSDAGSGSVRLVLQKHAGHDAVRVISHLPRVTFVSWMAACDVMVGNSSSGIIEAGTFGTPVLNIGVRQNLRQRNPNVKDIEPEVAAIRSGIEEAIRRRRFAPVNCYGDGQAGRRIAERLARIKLLPDLLLKSNSY